MITQAATSTPPAAARLRWLDSLLLAGLLALTVEQVGALFWRATLGVQVSFTEGWNAFNALAAFNGTPLYHGPQALVTNNYPPLSFLLTAATMHVLPDAVFAGRLLAGLSLLACVVLIALIVHAVTRSRLGAAFAGGVFAAALAVHQPDFVAADDPQMLTHALQLGALLVLLRNRCVPGAMAAGLLCAVSLLVKHNPLALPAALGLWLLATDWRRGAAFILAAGVVLLAGLGTSRAVYGPDFVTSLLLAPRVYSLGRAWHETAVHSSSLTPLLCLGALAFVLPALPLPWRRFLALYLGLGLLVGVSATTGQGVSLHALNDAIIAASLCAGHLVALAPTLRPALPGLRTWLIAAFGLAVFAAGPDVSDAKDVLEFPAWAAAQRALAAETQRVVAAIAAQPGPALCDTSIYCYWAGKEWAIDSFNFSEAVERKQASTDAVAAQVEAGAFPTVALQDPDGHSLLSHALIGWLRAHDTEILRTPRQVVFVRTPAPAGG